MLRVKKKTIKRKRAATRVFLDCVKHKTVYFAGNSISRGLYFTMGAMLAGLRDTGVQWMDLGYQKKMCNKTKEWPPQPSCSTKIDATGTTLVNTWTQKLNELDADLTMSFRTYRPDVSIVEVGLDHVASEFRRTEGGKFAWEQSLDRHFGHVADVVERYFNANPAARLLWRPVSHFNETNQHFNNAAVDSWNKQLLRRISERQWLTKKWFRWYTSAAQVIDRALRGEGGLHMDDWVHPDTNSHLRITSNIIESACA